MAKILVIDDSVSVLELVASILREAGHEVITTDSGRKGVSLLDSGAPDLVITDIYMPGLDGLEVIRAARRLRPGQRVLAMSVVTGARGLLEIARALGAAGTLVKPFAVGELLEAVDACLRGRSSKEGSETRV